MSTPGPPPPRPGNPELAAGYAPDGSEVNEDNWTQRINSSQMYEPGQSPELSGITGTRFQSLRQASPFYIDTTSNVTAEQAQHQAELSRKASKLSGPAAGAVGIVLMASGLGIGFWTLVAAGAYWNGQRRNEKKLAENPNDAEAFRRLFKYQHPVQAYKATRIRLDALDKEDQKNFMQAKARQAPKSPTATRPPKWQHAIVLMMLTGGLGAPWIVLRNRQFARRLKTRWRHRRDGKVKQAVLDQAIWYHGDLLVNGHQRMTPAERTMAEYEASQAQQPEAGQKEQQGPEAEAEAPTEEMEIPGRQKRKPGRSSVARAKRSELRRNKAPSVQRETFYQNEKSGMEAQRETYNAALKKIAALPVTGPNKQVARDIAQAAVDQYHIDGFRDTQTRELLGALYSIANVGNEMTLRRVKTFAKEAMDAAPDGQYNYGKALWEARAQHRAQLEKQRQRTQRTQGRAVA